MNKVEACRADLEHERHHDVLLGGGQQLHMFTTEVILQFGNLLGIAMYMI